MSEARRTCLYDRHVSLKAKIVEFGGWDMPLFYPTGIVTEHLATRRNAGLFDVSHMGRFVFRGGGALAFLQHALTNNAEALEEGQAQYTVIPNEQGGALDDAFLYRFKEDEYLLVVNAANADKDWDHLRKLQKDFPEAEMIDRTRELAMLSLQGPESKRIIKQVVSSGRLPEPMRNYLSILQVDGHDVMTGRTGYTGEPICFEMFVPSDHGPAVWDLLLEKGAQPVGLGARDTLRLEAGLPLYGHELGLDPEDREIPVLACPQARFAVSFSPLKGDYVGREVLAEQFEALKGILRRDYTHIKNLPRMIRPFAMTGRGVGRAGDKVFKDDKQVGWVTSGTTVPYWEVEGEGLSSDMTDKSKIRAVGLALIDSDIIDEETITVEIRKKTVHAVVVPFHLRGEAPPLARPIVYGLELEAESPDEESGPVKAKRLIEDALANHRWRQEECINLIPSEMTQSPHVRLLSGTDPVFRYGEHKQIEAFYEADIFFYQGTDFISRVEHLLEEEFRKFLGCPEVETRLISGQMANTAVFSAMVDYINRVDRRREPRRIRMVLNNHIGKGGHLSAQPMGALRDYVARDPHTERPAVVNFAVLPEDRFRIDLEETYKLIDRFKPEFIIFGKSMVLYKEPVAQVRKYIDDLGLNTMVMYDMAHVLGLIGQHFQEPFKEGADLVTGSTHKTFFGSQRGVVGCNVTEQEERWEFWEALRRRAFPGSVSNHHLGTLLGLLMAAYEMNHFKDQYQPQVVANAKALARALKDSGLDPAGDPGIDFTETHQVVVNVPYAKGPEIARRLEDNNIICNYQAGPDDEGFTAAGSLRLGVSEMTRFGMKEEDFKELAGLMADVVLNNARIREKVKALRNKFSELQFCFTGNEFDDLRQKLHQAF